MSIYVTKQWRSLLTIRLGYPVTCHFAACSSLAWLNFMQSLDLEQLQEEEGGRNGEKNNSASTGTLDWVDAWLPADEQATKSAELTNKKIQAANVNRHRQLLQQELHRIQRGLQLKDRKTLAKEHIQLIRDQGCRKTNIVPKNIVRFSTNDDAFCVDEYESDNEYNLQGRSIHRSKPLNSFTDTEDEDEDQQHYKNQKIQNTKANAVTDAVSLLNGGLLDGSSLLPSSGVFGNVQPGSGVRKIIYAARTHSQLSQFVSEIRRAVTSRTDTSQVPKVVSLGGRSLLCGNEAVVGKGKRSSDINEAWITEQCLDMKKGANATAKPQGIVHIHNTHAKQRTSAGKRKKTSSPSTKGGTTTSGCPLLRHQEEAVAVLGLHFLAVPSDIEDEALLGKSSQTCAYYATRLSIPAADVVAVPYATLLSKENREAVGLALKNACVIIDEAHNIPEAMRSLKNCTLNLPNILLASTQLQRYMARYSNRIAGRNLFYLSQIHKCIKAMIDYLSNYPSNSVATSKLHREENQRQKPVVMMSTNELLFTLKLDNVNLYKLARYFKVSKLSQKLLGFVSADQKENNCITEGDPANTGIHSEAKEFTSKHVSAMSFVQNFLQSLNNEPASSGKVIAQWPSKSDEEGVGINTCASSTTLIHPEFRYVLLNPAADFKGIVKEAYAVIFAGGTLSPFTHMCSELLHNIGYEDDQSQIIRDAAAADNAVSQSVLQAEKPFVKWQSDSFVAFSCGHVVPPSNIFISCLSEGPTGKTKLDFRHSGRTAFSICDELGLAVLELIRVIPAGVIMFFPSYSYEDHLVRRWRQTGLLEKLRAIKYVHREPKQARDTKDSLEAYNRDASSKRGALLLSIIGGKMSEGINFADDLARCVIVVGLPYPDISDPVLIEKMKSLDRTVELQKNTSNHFDGALLINGRSYYKNLCMRAVNQSVGRAFRHVNDYAAVILADFRYSSDSVWNKLPNWLRSSSEGSPRQLSLSSTVTELSKFYGEKKQHPS